MEQHNASAQRQIARNVDPALDRSHEHGHRHLHHDEYAEKGRHDDVVYTTGTTAEKSDIPDQDPNDHALHRRNHPERRVLEKDGAIAYDHKYDAENGGMGPVDSSPQEKDPQGHKVARFYARYRIFFHLFLFMLFTG